MISSFHQWLCKTVCQIQIRILVSLSPEYCGLSIDITYSSNSPHLSAMSLYPLWRWFLLVKFASLISSMPLYLLWRWFLLVKNASNHPFASVFHVIVFRIIRTHDITNPHAKVIWKEIFASDKLSNTVSHVAMLLVVQSIS